MAQAGTNSGAETNSAERNRPWRHFPHVQLVLGLGLAIGLILAVNFSSRIQLDRDLGLIQAQITAEIAALIVEGETLEEKLDDVKRDAYVEQWARDEGKMIRQGEILVMPQGIDGESSQQQSTVKLFEFQTTSPEPENWELWWALFFDNPPPSLD